MRFVRSAGMLPPRILMLLALLALPSAAAAQVEEPIISVEISAGNVIVGESAGKAVVTVKLSESSSDTVTVQYQTVDDTAKASSDYTSTNGTLVFSSGQTEKTIEVTITNDSSVENTEYFNVELSNPVNGKLDPDADSGQVKIHRRRRPAADGAV